jgi:hypothetical protein
VYDNLYKILNKTILNGGGGDECGDGNMPKFKEY